MRGLCTDGTMQRRSGYGSRSKTGRVFRFSFASPIRTRSPYRLEANRDRKCSQKPGEKLSTDGRCVFGAAWMLGDGGASFLVNFNFV